MNILRWLGTGLLSLWLCMASVVLAENEASVSPDIEHKFELAKKYYGECAATEAAEFENIRPYLKAFTDIDVMTDTMADPARMAQLMTIVSDPRTLHVMSKCATEPVMWDSWMRGVTDWQGMMRAIMKFTHPGIYMNWMMAPMNPASYQPMMQMMQPDWYGRWMTATMNPTFYQPLLSMTNPNWYMPRMAWMMNPTSFQPMFNALAFPGHAVLPSPQPVPPQTQAEEKPGTE